MKQKKGVSPVIATVLLVGLTVILAGIIFLWARQSIPRDIISTELMESYCKETDIDAGFFEEGLNIVFEINNRGNVPIEGVKIKAIKAGDVKVVENIFNKSLGAGQS